MEKKALTILLEIAIAAAAVSSWLWILAFGDKEAFSAAGLHSLRYYTVLSNLFAGASSLLFAVFKARERADRPVPAWVTAVKTSSVAALGVTFTVVLVFLGPVFGYPIMFQGGNLFMHLITPLTAFFVSVFLEEPRRLRFPSSALCVLPTVIYGVFYLYTVLLFGAAGNDLYGFVRWGYFVGFLIFVLILAGNFGLVELLCFLSRRLKNFDKKESAE